MMAERFGNVRVEGAKETSSMSESDQAMCVRIAQLTRQKRLSKTIKQRIQTLLGAQEKRCAEKDGAESASRAEG